MRAKCLSIGTVFILLASVSPAHSWQSRFAFANYAESGDIAIAGDGSLLLAGTAGRSVTFFTVLSVDPLSLETRWKYQAVGGSARRLFVLPGGDVIAGGSFVARVNGSTGGEQWRFNEPAPGELQSITVGAGGDVFGLGDDSDRLFVERINGASGASVWRHVQLDPAKSRGQAIAVDPSGDVLVAGELARGFAVLKLSGATGEEIWRYTLPDSGFFFPDTAYALAFDALSDVYVTGKQAEQFVVAKLAAATGAEVWLKTLQGSSAISPKGLGSALRLTQAGNLVAAGTLYNDATLDDLAVVQLEPSSGVEMWRYEFDGAGASPYGDMYPDWERERAGALFLDAAGDIFAAGTILNADYQGSNGDFVLSKLSGADGSEIWRFEGSGRYKFPLRHDEVVALAMDGAGNVAATFNAEWRPAASAYAQMGLAAVYLTGSDGTDLLPAKLLDLRDSGAGLSLKLSVQLGASAATRAPADPVLSGGTLELINPVTGETTSLPLEAAGWRYSQTYTMIRTVRYSGPVCRVVKIQLNGRMTIRCDAVPGFTLDEGTQGTIAVRLTTGTGAAARRYCMVFGGTIERDAPGTFRAADAPVPLTCPFPP